MKAEKKKKNKPILNQSVAEHSIHKKHSCASLFSPCSLFFLRLLTVTLIKLFSLSRLLPLVSLLLLIDEKKNKKKRENSKWNHSRYCCYGCCPSFLSATVKWNSRV